MDSLLLQLARDETVSRVMLDFCGSERELVRHVHKDGTGEMKLGGLKESTTDIPNEVEMSRISVAMESVSATPGSVITGALVYKGNMKIDNSDFYRELAEEIASAQEAKRLRELERLSGASSKHD